MLLRLAPFLLCLPLFALTTVTGTLKQADGTGFSGTIYVSHPTFTNATSQIVFSEYRTPYTITAGALSIALEPSVGRSFVYTINYNLRNGRVVTEYWAVPTTGPVDVGAVRTTVYLYPTSSVGLAMLSASGAVQGDYFYFNGTAWTHLTPPGVTFTAQTTVPLTHNLGTRYVTFDCWDTVGNKQVEPASVVPTSTTVTTFLFNSATTGVCSVQ